MTKPDFNSPTPGSGQQKNTAEDLGVDREDGSADARLINREFNGSSHFLARNGRQNIEPRTRFKLNAPAEWEWFSARVLTPTDDTLLEGAIPNRRKDGTPRKGREKWTGVEGQSCVVTRSPKNHPTGTNTDV